MKLKQDGFSIIELLAILFITTALIAPLMSTLVGNVEINNRTQFRRSATSIAEGTIYGLEKIDFSDFRTQLDAANSSTYYIEFNSTTCNSLTDTADQNLCTEIFSTIWSNVSLDETEYKVYMFNHSLTSAQHSAIYNNGSIEPEAQTLIENDPDILANLNQTDIPDLIRVIIWIDYYDDPDLHVTLTGLIFND